MKQSPLPLLLLLSFLSARGQNYTIYTFAGGALPDHVSATSAGLYNVSGVAVDRRGNLYLAATGLNAVFRVDATTRELTRIAGTGIPGSSGDGGPAIAARLNGPQGVAVDGAGAVYIADTDNNEIRKVSGGTIATVAGSASVPAPFSVKIGSECDGSPGYIGPATSAKLSCPTGVAVDASGNLYIADKGNDLIREVSKGVMTTIAGIAITWHDCVVSGNCSANGAATGTRLSRPSGVAVDEAGSLYIADTGNNVIRKVSNGLVTTVAGSGTYGNFGASGPATRAALAWPKAVAVDASGNLYIADSSFGAIHKVSNGVITTIARPQDQSGVY